MQDGQFTTTWDNWHSLLTVDTEHTDAHHARQWGNHTQLVILLICTNLP